MLAYAFVIRYYVRVGSGNCETNGGAAVSLSPLSGSAGGEGAPCGDRGASEADGLPRFRRLSAYREADALCAVDDDSSRDDGGISQEEILDQIVAATLAQDDPLDDELADGDYWDP